MRSSSCFYISNYPLSGNCASHQEHIDNGFYTLIGNVMETKVCRKCKAKKKLSEFNKDRSRNDGFSKLCKLCDRKRGREYYCRVRKGNAEHYQSRRPKKINSTLIRKYGITLDQRNQMIDNQNGKCAICGNVLVDGFGTAVDHDHKTGKIRGILCGSCNGGLGLFKDNISSLLSAIKYLQVDANTKSKSDSNSDLPNNQINGGSNDHKNKARQIGRPESRTGFTQY